LFNDCGIAELRNCGIAIRQFSIRQFGTGVLNATGNHSVAVHDVQGQELLHDEEPEDDAGPFGDEQVLPEVPQAHAA
jgi:hypothetical protein